jgi:hypothetical protein
MSEENFYQADYLEQVYVALFNQVRCARMPDGTEMFKTALRVVDTPDDVAPAAQPALFQVQGPIAASQSVKGGDKWEASAMLVVYVRADGAIPSQQQMLPDTVANYIVWGIKSAMTNSTLQGNVLQTLGGLVYHAWIDGAVIPAVADQQIVIAVPVKILF